MKLAIILFIVFNATGTFAAEGPRVSGSKDGRFQLVQVGYEYEKYLIDSQTGRLWTRVCAGLNKEKQCLGYIWLEEVIENVTDKKAYLNAIKIVNDLKEKQ